MTALLHSNQLRTVERITFDAASNRMKLVMELMIRFISRAIPAG